MASIPYDVTMTYLLKHFGAPIDGIHSQLVKHLIDRKALNSMKKVEDRVDHVGPPTVDLKHDDLMYVLISYIL